ncbi:MAG TPA: hypothetical protein DGP39_01480 [Verrucomicrobiales bacterium]|nr:hypothetical protein [Verrucomicrobiales bacterium]
MGYVDSGGILKKILFIFAFGILAGCSTLQPPGSEAEHVWNNWKNSDAFLYKLLGGAAKAAAENPHLFIK